MRHLFIIILLLTVWNCKAKEYTQPEYGEEIIDYAALSKEKTLLFGGVSIETLTDSKSRVHKEYSRLLEQSLIGRYPEGHFISSSYLEKGIGKENFQNLTEEFIDYYGLKRKSLRMLQEKYDKGSYILMVHIYHIETSILFSEKNTDKPGQENSTDSVEDEGPTLDFRQKVHSGYYKKISVLFSIYDVHKEKLAANFCYIRSKKYKDHLPATKELLESLFKNFTANWG